MINKYNEYNEYNEYTENIDFTALQKTDIISDYSDNSDNEETEDASGPDKESPLANIKKIMSADPQLKIYIDYDDYFVVLYPVVTIGSDKYFLNDFRAGKQKPSIDAEIYMSSLCRFLSKYRIHQSKYMRALLTMPVIYTDDLLDFLLEAMPPLMNEATIYYTNNFKSVMIRNSLKVSFSFASGSIDHYLECNFDYDESITPDELAEIMNSLRTKDKLRFYQLRSGGFIDLRAEKVMETMEFLKKFGITRNDLEKRQILIPRCEIPFITGLVSQAETKKTAEFAGFDIKDIEKKLFSVPEAGITIPKNLQAELRPYQLEGYRWLKTLMHSGLGGVLADDMGLGKTLQTITLILSALEENKDAKTLIIVPTSLIDNWINEINRFAPSIKCAAVAGNQDIRNQVFERRNDYQVFITSYGLVLNDMKTYQKMKFDILVLDEAQRIKNHLTKTAKEIKKIKAFHKFALTGTPIENNLSELWSIYNWLMPPLLKDYKSFKARYITHTDNLEELRLKISPFLLRRIKKDVLNELPEKTETTIKIELSDLQKKLYLAYREEALRLLAETNQVFNTLPILTRLRQVCCHPGMFLDDYRESTGKLDILLDIIHELREEGRRALVFSQFTTMLDIIKDELQKKNIEYRIFDGRTPQKLRSSIISDFDSSGAPVFLISLKAGGTGLNLTSADTVIHFDPWWNPSVEEQASARVYRIGQKKCVQIIYLIAKGTIEESINLVKHQKKELIDKIIQPGGRLLTALSTEELRQLLE